MDMYPAHKANDDAEKSPFVIVGLGSLMQAVASDLRTAKAGPKLIRIECPLAAVRIASML
jgi:hypothetical protein